MQSTRGDFYNFIIVNIFPIHELSSARLLFIAHIIRLQARTLDALARLVKFDLLARHQTLLQRAADLDGVDGADELHRRRGVIQAARGELVGLGDEGLAEAAVVVGRDLATDARGLVQVDEVELRLRVDGDLAARAKDLSRVLLAGGHHAGAEELRDLAALFFA